MGKSAGRDKLVMAGNKAETAALDRLKICHHGRDRKGLFPTGGKAYPSALELRMMGHTMKLAVYAALATAAAATGAHAGGYVAPVVETPVVVTPAPEPVSVDWTGFYAGLQYGKGNLELSYAGESADTDADGYGLHAGYLHDFGKFVLGGEFDYNKVDLDDVDGDGDLYRLRARAGYDMGRFLPYVTLGAAHAKASDLSETGVTYGIGADFKVTDKFTVGAEYSRNDFSDIEDIDGLDLDSDLVQIRASYHF